MLDKFIKLNNKILKDFKSKESIVIVDRARPIPTIEASVMIAAIANKKKLKTIILTDKVYPNLIKIYKSFGYFNFHLVFNTKMIFVNYFMSFLSLIYSLYAIFFILLFNFEWLIKKYKIKNILIGDLIYDSYVRNNLSFIKPKIDIKFVRLLFITNFRFFKIKKFFKKNRVKYLFILTDCYAGNEGISYRIALKNNIKIYKIASSDKKIFLTQIRKHQIYHGFMPLHKYFSKNSLISKINIKQKKLNVFLNKRFNGKIDFGYCSIRDLKNSNKVKKNITKDQLIKKYTNNKEKIKKVVLFAPHAFSDVPHYLGSFIFRDYFDQFIETTKYIEELKKENILWLIRPHPTSEMYFEDNLLSSILKKKEINNLKICDANYISTKNLIKLCDNVITGRGSIGLEFACFGKKPIIAGASTYSKFDIAVESNSKKEYFENINNVLKIKPLSNKETMFAKKVLYYVESVYPRKISKSIDNLIFEKKKFSALSNLEKNYEIKKVKTVFTSKFLSSIKRKSFNKDEAYLFYLRNAKNI